MIYSHQQVLSVENTLRYSSYGEGDADGLLNYLNDRFGPISSFTGTYQADLWRLHLNLGKPNNGNYHGH